MNASTAMASTPKRRWWLWVPLLLLAAALGVWAALKFTTTGKRAELATGYIAHVVCSCRYVGNRDMKSCRTDFEPGTEIVRVTDDLDKRRITATVPLLSSRSATFDPEYGCALDKP